MSTWTPQSKPSNPTWTPASKSSASWSAGSKSNASWAAGTKPSTPAYTSIQKSLQFDYLLTEDVFFLLLEDSGKIITDQSGTLPVWAGQAKSV